MYKSEIIEKLSAVFSSQKTKPLVKLAYLFGSRVGGAVGPISDFDIAVL